MVWNMLFCLMFDWLLAPASQWLFLSALVPVESCWELRDWIVLCVYYILKYAGQRHLSIPCKNKSWSRLKLEVVKMRWLCGDSNKYTVKVIGVAGVRVKKKKKNKQQHSLSVVIRKWTAVSRGNVLCFVDLFTDLISSIYGVAPKLHHLTLLRWTWVIIKELLEGFVAHT